MGWERARKGSEQQAKGWTADLYRLKDGGLSAVVILSRSSLDDFMKAGADYFTPLHAQRMAR